MHEGLTGTLTDTQFSIGGSPREIGVFSFSLTTVGGQPDATDPGCTITVIEDTTIAKLESEGELYQEVFAGDAISNIIFTWGAGTKDVEITGLPEGLTVESGENSVVIKGTPIESANITVTSIGNGEPIVIESIITVIPESLKRVAYITDMSATNYSLDTKILPALLACKDLYEIGRAHV